VKFVYVVNMRALVTTGGDGHTISAHTVAHTMHTIKCPSHGKIINIRQCIVSRSQSLSNYLFFALTVAVHDRVPNRVGEAAGQLCYLAAVHLVALVAGEERHTAH
jgi:hypothetical protein